MRRSWDDWSEELGITEERHKHLRAMVVAAEDLLEITIEYKNRVWRGLDNGECYGHVYGHLNRFHGLLVREKRMSL